MYVYNKLFALLLGPTSLTKPPFPDIAFARLDHKTGFSRTHSVPPQARCKLLRSASFSTSSSLERDLESALPESHPLHIAGSSKRIHSVLRTCLWTSKTAHHRIDLHGRWNYRARARGGRVESRWQKAGIHPAR